MYNNPRRCRIESCCVGARFACAGYGEFQLPIAAVLILSLPTIKHVSYLGIWLYQVPFLLVTLWGSGPLSAAFSFVMRSFVYEKPIWIVSDSKPILKENLKQSLVVMLIDVGVLGLSAVAMEMYWTLEKTMPNGAVVFQIFQYILLFIIIVYTIMHPYIYQLMITFDCTIKELYKNAMFLSLAKLPLNLLLMLIGAAIIIVPIWFFGIYPLVVGILALTVGIVLTRFPLEFYAVQNIQKEMLEK